MGDSSETKQRIVRFENVMIGEATSRLSAGIFFLLCAVPVFSTILFGAVDTTTWIFITIFWLIIILLWLLEAWKARGFLFSPSALQLPVAGLLLIGIVQLLPLGGGQISGDLLSVPYTHTLSLEPYATRFFLIRLAVYAVFFAACLTFINNERRLKKVVLLVIIFGASMAFLGILLRLANPEGVYGLRETPQAIPFGPFVNQHHFAAFMQITGGVAIAFLFEKTAGIDKKMLLTTAVVVMGIATVLTSSRGGLLGFVSVLIFVVLTKLVSRERPVVSQDGSVTSAGLQRKVALAAAGTALILVIFGAVLFLGGNESLFRGIGLSLADNDISSGRTHFWPIGLRIFLEHPIFGAGFDAFGVPFTRLDTWNGAIRVEQAHNDYLQTLADAGVAGFSCVAAFIYFLFKKGLRTIESSKDSFRRNAAIGSLAGCFGILIHSFFDFPLRTPSNAFFFLLLAAVATVSIKSSDVDESPRRRNISTAL